MTKKTRAFTNTVWKYYQAHGRHDLPWRKTGDPYKILVSEIMLQQTQVDRVLPKYKAFLKEFPSVRALARAPLSLVLKAWQGLGYNRRAKMLHETAKEVVTEHNGTFPNVYTELIHLPGIGPYTASAILAFAFNQPVSMIETNIRTAYLHHFFKDETDVTDKELVRYIALTLDAKRPREWYWALMDYGAHLKKEHGNPNSRSKHYTKQSKFDGSDRQIRGATIRFLTRKNMTRKELVESLKQYEDIRIDTQLERLKCEGMLIKKGRSFSLPQ